MSRSKMNRRPSSSLETFSFKSQRRPTSSLSLAFYVEGLIDSVTSECCEFKCVQKNSNVNDQKQFLFKDIQKANPCEKYVSWFLCVQRKFQVYYFRCRKEYADNLLRNNDKNTLLVRVSSSFTSNIFSRSHRIILEKPQILSKSW